MNHHLWRILAVGLLALLMGAGCSSPCQESLGTYPPDHIIVTGVEAVDVPHIAWECPGFHSDSMDPPPSVAPNGQGLVRVDVHLEDGSTIEVRFGNQPAALDPSPTEGDNSWSFQVAATAEPLIVRLCSAEEACAMYWANLYSG